MPPRKRPSIPDELLDALLVGTDAKTALLETGGLLDSLKNALSRVVAGALAMGKGFQWEVFAR